MRKSLTGTIGLAMAALILVPGCSGQPLTTREKGTIGGGLLGAGTGAIIGAAVGHPGAGAAIGGGLIGNELQNVEIAQNHNRSTLHHQQRELRHQRREIESLRASAETE
jgi:uncharacterized protein YcfJ